jgi:phenylalanyl-tRNA synthetase beta chain
MPPQIIDLDLRELRRSLGIDIAASEVNRILTALDFRVEVRGGSAIRAVAPAHRVDIQDGPADLIEEVARVHGYDHLPATLLADSLPAQHGNAELLFEERVRDLLVGYGLQEFITYSLTTKDREAPLTPRVCEYIKLLNPITSERDSMRHTVLAGLLECTAANLRHASSVMAFEIGPVFWGQSTQKLPDEPARLGIVMTGSLAEPTWSGTPSAVAEFFDLKGVVENLFDDLHIDNATIVSSAAAHLHPGKSADLLLGGTSAGVFGELHPKVAQAFDLARRRVLVAEFDVDRLRSAAAGRFQYRSVPRFPAALRDVAVIIAEDIPAHTVASEIRAGGGELLENLRLFDVYRGASIPPGTKSLAFALTYLASDRTLTDKEVDKAHKKIEDRLKHVLKAAIRGKD